MAPARDQSEEPASCPELITFEKIKYRMHFSNPWGVRKPPPENHYMVGGLGAGKIYPEATRCM